MLVNSYRHSLNDLPDNFYPSEVMRIVPMCGGEYVNRRPADFHTAVEVLNKDLCLNLDGLDVKAMALMLTGLGGANRFRGDIHIAPECGENSAVHCCHTAILVTEMFRRAGLLECLKAAPEVEALRHLMTLSALVHDMGEMLGEFSTVAERTNDRALREEPEIERCIFKRSLELAYYSSEVGAPENFYIALFQMRSDLEHLKASSLLNLARLEQLLERYRPAGEMVLSSARISRLLKAFDLAELKDASAGRLFAGYAVKALEHLQGTRHLLRFGDKGSAYRRINIFSPRSLPYSETVPRYGQGLTVPLDLCSSSRILNNIRYAESEVGYLFHYAEGEAEIALAKVIRDSVYQTVVETLSLKNPVMDREEIQPDRITVKLCREIRSDDLSRGEKEMSHAMLLERLASRRKEMFNERSSELGSVQSPLELESKLLRYESRRRLISLYLSAIEKDYCPQPGELLLLRKEVPPELLPLKPRSLKALRGSKPGF